MQQLRLSLLLWLLALGFYPATGALAAGPGWIGGGGLLHKDSGNPWWVKNTKEVAVCVQIDEANFGLTHERATEITRTALAWWKRVLKPAVNAPFEESGVGQQNFTVSSKCTAATDLHIQFGVLSKAQRTIWNVRIGEPPQEYVGIAIRTDYDSASLKGKGFIYLSPQEGPLKLRTTSAQSNKPWSIANGRLAYLFLLHELGHVFGFDHGSKALMDPSWMDFVLRADVASIVQAWPKDDVIPSPFQFEGGRDIRCYQTDEFRRGREFFGLGSGEICIAIETNATALALYQASSEQGPWTLVSSGSLLKTSTYGIWGSNTVFLPSEQRVFWFAEPNPNFGVRFGVSVEDFSQLELKSVDGKRVRQLAVRLGPPKDVVFLPTLDLIAVVDGKPVFDIFSLQALDDVHSDAEVSHFASTRRDVVSRTANHATRPVEQTANYFMGLLHKFRPR
jgi:hypothetical protein